MAIFGPSTSHMLGEHVGSICDALEIPHMEARMDADSEYKSFSVNVYPPLEQINQAFIDVMDFLNWTKVDIIYEEDSGSIRFDSIVHLVDAITTNIITTKKLYF